MTFDLSLNYTFKRNRTKHGTVMDNKTKDIQAVFLGRKSGMMAFHRLQNWLLVFVSVVVFFVLPTVLTWSLSGTIHAQHESLLKGMDIHSSIPLK